VCTEGIWMTVDTGINGKWSYKEAKVICQELGFYGQCT
jgi:hypothetical protein